MIPRFFTFLLAAMFCFNFVPINVSVVSAQTQVKRCCCKTGICKCQHKDGKICPLQKTAALKERSQEKVPFWTALGCGSHEEKTQIPNYAKHYFNLEDKVFIFHPVVTYLNDRYVSFQFLFDYRFDRPPREVLQFPL